MTDIPARPRSTSPSRKNQRPVGLKQDITAHVVVTGITLLIMMVPTWAYFDAILAYFHQVGLQPSLPSLDELRSVSPVIALHATAALVALVLGAGVLFRRKGTAMHKALGRIWVGAMVLTAGSGAFIPSFQPLIGPFGVIHLFSVWTAWSLPVAILRARQGRIDEHRNMMIGLYIGLWLAGLFSLIPGRTLFALFLT